MLLRPAIRHAYLQNSAPHSLTNLTLFIQKGQFRAVANLPELAIIAKIFNVPKKLILAVIYTEDLRFEPLFQTSVHSLDWQTLKNSASRSMFQKLKNLQTSDFCFCTCF